MHDGLFLGIEIGGTKLQLGVGSGQGPPFVGFRRQNVDAKKGAAGIRAQIEETGSELIAQYSVQGIGFGFGGPIDAAQGIVTKSHQVAGWDGFPLVEWCQKTFGLPTFLGNDCDMAALAEARFGAGRGRRSVFYITVGTGVGGGLVLDGRLYGSDRPAVAEIGHLRPGLEATEPNVTIESLAAGPAIERAARSALADLGALHPDAAQLLAACRGDVGRLSGKMIAESAAAGNGLACTVIEGASRALGWGIAQTITLLAVETVIVGGGVSLAGETFFKPLSRFVAQFVFPPLRGSYAIVPPQLGEEVVVHGAIAQAASHFAARPSE